MVWMLLATRRRDQNITSAFVRQGGFTQTKREWWHEQRPYGQINEPYRSRIVARCRYCLLSMGDLALMRDEFYSSICSADGYTVARMLSSILSEQKAHNTTVEVPALTSTDSSTATATLDLSDNTMSHEALTTTMYGVAFASLPQIAAPTETSGSIGWGVPSKHFVGVVYVVVLARVYNV